MRNPFRVFTRRQEDSTEQRAMTSVPWEQGGLAQPSRVTVERALRLGPVYAAGDRLAGLVASLPLQAYRKAGDNREKLPLPPLFRTPSMSAQTLHNWLYRAVVSLAYRGNAIGLITGRDSLGRPRTVEWLHPDWVSVEDSLANGPGSFTDPIWYYRGRIIPREHLVHIPWFVVPGKVLGLSPIAAYASTIRTGLAAQEYSDDWFTAGGVPPGTFRNTQKQVPQKDARIIKARMGEAIRTHEPIVFGADWEYTPIAVAPNEARFVETMKLSATQIAAIYGIPPEMIGGETGNSLTYSNVEQHAINLVQFTLMPWLTRFESAFTMLMPASHYVKFNVDALIRPDSTTRYRNYEWARSIGMLNIDEIRALEDMPPLPNGQGQSYTPLSLMGVKTSTQTPVQRFSGTLDLDEDRDVSKLAHGHGKALWDYWTKGEGLARWSGAEHKWTTLHRLLLEEGVPAHEAKGLATNIIEHVLPGYMKKAHHG